MSVSSNFKTAKSNLSKTSKSPMTKKIFRAVCSTACALVLSGCVATAPTVPTGPTTNFDRFSPDLPQLLEADALTVLTLGMTNEFSAKICTRVPLPVGAVVSYQVDEWKNRNARFTRGASGAINEIASRIERAQGASAKQSYMNQTLLTTAGKANSTIVRKFDGANLDNAKVPTAKACSEVSEYLRAGAADFDRTPQYTRELSRYMERRGIR